LNLEKPLIRLPISDTEDFYEIDPRIIIAVGLNYQAHIAEHHTSDTPDLELPKEPILFSKTPNALISSEQSIVIPRFIDDYGFQSPRVDEEAELAFVIGKKSRNVSREAAMEHILGFTCVNDVSQRNFQKTDVSGWFRAKSLDTFCPIGPVLVPTGDIKDPQNLTIECRVNGKLVQSSNTKHMIFPIAELLEFITKHFTLMPGDIVTTGTPNGVHPLRHGDIVEVEIEKIGVLRNFVFEEQ